MKRSIFIFVLAALMLGTFCGCNQNPPESVRPTWTPSPTYDFTSSMTAVVKIATLSGKEFPVSDLNANDMLAAFIGDECCGVIAPQNDLFFLYIAGPAGKQEAKTVTLRYWSEKYKNVFTAQQGFEFVNDTQKGTPAEPFAIDLVFK